MKLVYLNILNGYYLQNKFEPSLSLNDLKLMTRLNTVHTYINNKVSHFQDVLPKMKTLNLKNKSYCFTHC